MPPAGSPEAHAAAVKANQTRREQNTARMAAGKPWAREFEHCTSCGKTDSPHRAKGICERCSIRDRAPGRSKAERPPFRAATAAPKLSALQVRNVKTLLVFGIAGADAAAGSLAPQYWTAADRLEKSETTALVEAVYAELTAWPPDSWVSRFVVFLAGAAEQGVHVQLGWCLGMIALPRLVRHGLVPESVYDKLVGVILSGGVPGAVPDSVSVESDSAHVGGGEQWNGKIYAGGVAGEPAPVPNGVPVEAR